MLPVLRALYLCLKGHLFEIQKNFYTKATFQKKTINASKYQTKLNIKSDFFFLSYNKLSSLYKLICEKFKKVLSL